MNVVGRIRGPGFRQAAFPDSAAMGAAPGLSAVPGVTGTVAEVGASSSLSGFMTRGGQGSSAAAMPGGHGPPGPSPPNPPPGGGGGGYPGLPPGRGSGPPPHDPRGGHGPGGSPDPSPPPGRGPDREPNGDPEPEGGNDEANADTAGGAGVPPAAAAAASSSTPTVKNKNREQNSVMVPNFPVISGLIPYKVMLRDYLIIAGQDKDQETVSEWLFAIDKPDAIFDSLADSGPGFGTLDRKLAVVPKAKLPHVLSHRLATLEQAPHKIITGRQILHVLSTFRYGIASYELKALIDIHWLGDNRKEAFRNEWNTVLTRTGATEVANAMRTELFLTALGTSSDLAVAMDRFRSENRGPVTEANADARYAQLLEILDERILRDLEQANVEQMQRAEAKGRLKTKWLGQSIIAPATGATPVVGGGKGQGEGEGVVEGRQPKGGKRVCAEGS